MIDKNRRGLFKTLSTLLKPKKTKAIRPPYSLNLFKECVECEGVCKTVCEESIIEIDGLKAPILNFKNSGCTFCKECARSCPKGVLSLNNAEIINATVKIDLTLCLAWNNTMCFSCKDACIYNSIEFLGLFRPEIKDNCVACGFCYSVCPVNAIEIKADE